MSDDLVKVTVSDGKYTFIQRKDGSCAALRYGEPWRDDIFDGLMLGMAHRIEELEAANKLLNEQLDSIEDMGTESLNALPDCLMQLAPALVENDELKAKLAEAMEALREVSQALDWQAHGACRGWSDNLLTPVNALKLARITIAKIIGEQP